MTSRRTRRTRPTRRTRLALWLLLAGLLAPTGVLAPAGVLAASHREAPATALDTSVDITDVYAFRSWEDPSKAVFIMNVHSMQEPAGGPNYFPFDDSIVYRIHIDVDEDNVADDIVYEFRFETEIRPGALPFAYAGLTGVPTLPAEITALDGVGSEGLGLRQRYTVTEKRGATITNQGLGDMYAVPSNVGPRTTPDYETLAEKGIYDLGNGGRVFAGPRDDHFYIDLGGIFDTLNLRRSPPLLNPSEDLLGGFNPFGKDALAGLNVNTIALEVVTEDLGLLPDALLGIYASTNRARYRIRLPDGSERGLGAPVPIARMGNPFVNELIIGTADKDRWNAADPRFDVNFAGYFADPAVALVMSEIFGISVPTTSRVDVFQRLLKYPGQAPICDPTNVCADLLRVDLSVAPTAPEDQKRLGPLAGDAAGYPNGRRPGDDVTDIILRIIAGSELGPVAPLGDGVNFNSGAVGSNLAPNGIYTEFPFLATPHGGFTPCDCGEPI